MTNCPAVVTAIANDYMERVTALLRFVPLRERDEFRKEIESHIYEAWRQTPGDDDVAKILAVLRNLGEPGELVADRLPGSMVRSGAKQNLPLYILAGILIALFGVPLGFGGVAVLVGILLTLAAFVMAYYIGMGTLFLTGGAFAFLGLIRLYRPELWDRLVLAGMIHLDDSDRLFLQLSYVGQGLLLIAIATALIGGGLGMLRAGRYLIRGLRFLYSLAFDWMRRLAQSARRKLHQHGNGASGPISYVKLRV